MGPECLFSPVSTAVAPVPLVTGAKNPRRLHFRRAGARLDAAIASGIRGLPTGVECAASAGPGEPEGPNPWRDSPTSPEGMTEHLLKLPLPEFDDTALVAGPPLAERRVAIVTSAGLLRRGEERVCARGCRLPGYPRRRPGLRPPHEPHLGQLRPRGLRRGHERRVPDRQAAGARGGRDDWLGRRPSLQLHGRDGPRRRWPRPADQVAGHLAADRVDAVLLTPV